MKWEFAVAVQDESDLESGHKRKKAGDIIAVKPHPWEWGVVENKHFLIVVVDGLTEEQAHRLCIPHYEDGEPPNPGKDEKPKKIINKRRFNIPLNKLKLLHLMLDLKKVADKRQAYQPLKKVTFDISKHDILYDKHLNRIVRSL